MLDKKILRACRGMHAITKMAARAGSLIQAKRLNPARVLF